MRWLSLMSCAVTAERTHCRLVRGTPVQMEATVVPRNRATTGSRGGCHGVQRAATGHLISVDEPQEQSCRAEHRMPPRCGQIGSRWHRQIVLS